MEKRIPLSIWHGCYGEGSGRYCGQGNAMKPTTGGWISKKKKKSARIPKILT